MIGQTLRGYRIVTELGSGSMGVVYYGEHQAIGRRAAIKVLNPAVAGNEDLAARFFTEARVVNAIRHPNIVDIIDFGEFSGGYYLVMELLEGETVGSRLERHKRLGEATAAAILAQVAAAVGAVHERGIVHRDLKPENLFLTSHPDYPDFVKVLDFGVVKLLAPLGPGEARRTQPGLVIGTPAYMSPEQCRGDPHVDQRTDIYSLGVIAFELVTGRTPFTGTVLEQLHAHGNIEPVSVRELVSELSERYDAFVLRCLKKQPTERFASMREVRDELRALGGAAATPAPRARPPGSLSSAASGPGAAPDETVERIERVQSQRVADQLRGIVSARLAEDKLSLPSLPAVAVKCLDLLNDPDVRFARLTKAMEQDALMAARVLRLVNSPYFGARERISSLEAAASRLGIKQLRLLVQEFAAHQLFSSRNPRIRTTFREVWEHCLGVAQLSRSLAQALARSVEPETAYLAGLVHDIGKPLVATLLLEAERNLSDQDAQWMSETLWLKTVNRSHRDVGVALVLRWHLPEEVVEVVAQQGAYDGKGRRSCVNLVRYANALCKLEGLYVGPLDEAEVAQTVAEGRRALAVDEALETRLLTGLAQQVRAATDDDDGGAAKTHVGPAR